MDVRAAWSGAALKAIADRFEDVEDVEGFVAQL
jgi:hypothetical protein